MSFKNNIFQNNYSVYTPQLSHSSKENFQEGALSTDLNNILIKYDDIRSEINKYNTTKNASINNPNSDFSSEKLDYTNQTKTLHDGTQDDLQIMLLNQYNMYMAGVITTATLIVFAILLTRE